MKFTIVCICMLLVLVTFCTVLSAAATATTHARSETVGLYAPDRYEGIPEKCLQPMDFGYCRAKVKRYYFDLRRMKCTMFFWGGCAGNLNNFKSIDDCNKVCLDGIEDNAFAQNAAPAPSYASNAARSTPTVTKKFASPSSSSSKINENVNNNYKESALPTYSSSNFNKFKINRNYNVPSTTKESILDDIDEEEDYDN